MPRRVLLPILLLYAAVARYAFVMRARFMFIAAAASHATPMPA